MPLCLCYPFHRFYLQIIEKPLVEEEKEDIEDDLISSFVIMNITRKYQNRYFTSVLKEFSYVFSPHVTCC